MTAHIHIWHRRDGSLPWMRYCACGAEAHVLGAGQVVELQMPANHRSNQ